MANCKFMGVTVDLSKVASFKEAAEANETVAMLLRVEESAFQSLNDAKQVAREVGNEMPDFDAAWSAVDAAAAAVSDASRAVAVATRRVVQQLVARDNLRALHAKRVAV